MKRIILGVKIDSLSFDDVLRRIDSLIVKRKSSQIVTVNPEFIMTAQKDTKFRQIINSADLAVPDGFGLMLAGKFLSTPLQERVTGVDLTWAICKLAEDRGYRVFFLGGRPGVAKETASRIKKLHPLLKVAGFYAGNPGDKRTINIIRKTKPDILFVAFGAPKQEKFIYNLIHNVSDFPRVSVGVGGTFDYISGVHPYAPDWIRKLGLEWLYRLITQPHRFNRILTATIRFPWSILKSKLFYKI